jgi:hypothetical protein
MPKSYATSQVRIDTPASNNGPHTPRVGSRPPARPPGTLIALGSAEPPDDQTLEEIVNFVASHGRVSRLQHLLAEHQRLATAALNQFQNRK